MLLRAGLHGWSLQAGSGIVEGARPSAAQSVSGLECADLGLCYSFEKIIKVSLITV